MPDVFLAALAVAVLSGLSGCAPISVERAENLCLDDARLAQHPRGSVALGFGSGRGFGAGVDLQVSSDYLTGRDPSAVFSACVQRRSGQYPTRPLVAMPGWTG